MHQWTSSTHATANSPSHTRTTPDGAGQRIDLPIGGMSCAACTPDRARALQQSRRPQGHCQLCHRQGDGRVRSAGHGRAPADGPSSRNRLPRGRDPNRRGGSGRSGAGRPLRRISSAASQILDRCPSLLAGPGHRDVARDDRFAELPGRQLASIGSDYSRGTVLWGPVLPRCMGRVAAPRGRHEHADRHGYRVGLSVLGGGDGRTKCLCEGVSRRRRITSRSRYRSTSRRRASSSR